MSWVAVDKNGDEFIYGLEPVRGNEDWWPSKKDCNEDMVDLPKGSIRKLTGLNLTWFDKPVELRKGRE